MEFNSSLSINITDFITCFKGNSNNIANGFKEILFDDVLDKSICDDDELNDIDYNLILNLLNSIELPNNSIVEGCNLKRIYAETNKVSYSIEESKILSNEDIGNKEIEVNNQSSKEVKIIDSNIIKNDTKKIELSSEEIKLLKKAESIISENKHLFNKEIDNEEIEINNQNNKSLKTNLANNKIFNKLENSNIINNLNLIRNDNSQNKDKDLCTLEDIVSLEDDNLIINSNKLIKSNINYVNKTHTKEIPIIRQDYIGDDIIKTAKYLKLNNKELITVKVSPKELGDMTIKLINTNDKSSIIITINKSETYNLVNENKNEIIKHLNDLNINLKEISIEIKNNTPDNFSSNLSQDFTQNNQGSKQKNKKNININLNNKGTDDKEGTFVEENINILI